MANDGKYWLLASESQIKTLTTELDVEVEGRGRD
jgi:hypothetical protein